MSEVDTSEEIPNGDDSAFVVGDPTECFSAATSASAAVIETAPNDAIAAEHVYVATSQGLLSAEQFHDATVDGLKATHIVNVINDHDAIARLEAGLRTPTTPLPPPTPATPLSKEKGFRYTWDDSVHAAVLPVRCKNTNGELYKAKFGSGGRGKCIKSAEAWYTPNEFEALAGRASSKDWKRSIRYGGRTLQCLIEDGILQPHATSCTCAACCDDDAVIDKLIWFKRGMRTDATEPYISDTSLSDLDLETRSQGSEKTGPVRLFVPYKRRKKDSEHESDLASPKRVKIEPGKAPTIAPVTIAKEEVSGSLTVSSSHPLTVQNADSGETLQIVATDAQGNIVTSDAVVMTPLGLAHPQLQTLQPQPIQQQQQQPQQQQQQPIATAPTSVVAMDVMEQKQWWHLEEMSNNLLQQVQQLKIMIEQVKQQSLISKDSLVQQTRHVCEKEKNETFSHPRL